MNDVVTKPVVVYQSPEVKAAGTAILKLVKENQGLKNDAALGRFLELAPPVLSKIKHGRNSLSDGTLIRIFEKTKIPMETLLALRKGEEP